MEADPHDSDETNTELASNIVEHFHALGFLRFWSRAGSSDVEGSLLGLSIMCMEALMAKRGVQDSVACSITCACYRPSRSVGFYQLLESPGRQLGQELSMTHEKNISC